MSALEKDVRSLRDETDSRRAELLRRLTTEPPKLAAERRTLPSAAGPRLTALLREIDEIVLPRVLRLTVGSKELARLIVSHRRLIAVEMAGKPAAVQGSAGLADLLAARLVEIAETRAALALTITRRTAAPNHAEAACSVTSLRAALAEATAQGAFDRQLRNATANCSACLLWSDLTPQSHFSGTEVWAEPLKTLVQQFRAIARGNQNAARVSPVRTRGVVIPVDDTLVIVIASLETKGFAVVMPRKAGLDMVAAWPFY